MHEAAFEAPAATWVRFSSYRIVNGYIRPAKDARLEQYSPWTLYRRPAASDEVAEAPHRALLEMIPRLDRLTIPDSTQELILDWCRRYGLLGILHQDTHMAVLAPRWRGSMPGMLVHNEANVRLLQPVARRLIRNPRGWGDRSETGSRLYASDQLDDGELVRQGQPLPAQWQEHGWDHPWSLRRASGGEWLRQPLASTWGRFFPDVPEPERETYDYPVPGSPEFWRLYAEPVEEFLQNAATLHRTLNTFQILTSGPPADEPRVDPTSAHQAVAQLDSLFSGVHPILHFASDGSAHLQWNGASLLGSIAMMAVQDLLAGSRMLVCANTPCGELFLAHKYQAKFCSDRCRRTAQKRAYRQRLAAPARKRKARAPRGAPKGTNRGKDRHDRKHPRTR